MKKKTGVASFEKRPIAAAVLVVRYTCVQTVRKGVEKVFRLLFFFLGEIVLLSNVISTFLLEFISLFKFLFFVLTRGVRF